MNILIADSGSTGTAWVLLRNGTRHFFNSEGLNPYFHTQEHLTKVISDISQTKLLGKNFDAIMFFGAGSGNPTSRQKLEEVITKIFPNVDLKIESDLLGAAIACYGKENGIVSILGTGSNTGFYSDGKIIKQLPSLGYVLGDEGSGNYFGKMILRDYFYGKMPEDLRAYFKNKKELVLDEVLNKTYSESQPNRYLASFTTLLSERKAHPYVQNLLRTGFNEFLDKHAGYFNEYKTAEVSFVGSIAFLFKDELKELLLERNLKMGKLLKDPIFELANYYSN